MKIFERDLKITVEYIDRNLKILGYLIDNSHEMKIDLIVEPETMSIKGLTVEMLKVPYDICHEALGKLDCLIGLKIKSGINKQVLDLFGGSNGCVHIIELLRQCFNGATQGGIRMNLKDLDSDNRKKKLGDILKGSCIKYK